MTKDPSSGWVHRSSVHVRRAWPGRRERVGLKADTRRHSGPFSEKNTSSHSHATLWSVLYLYEKHSRGRGGSHSGIDKCCRLLLWSHFDCTGPKRTAVHRSTPRPLCRTEKQRGTTLNYITFRFSSILQKNSRYQLRSSTA